MVNSIEDLMIRTSSDTVVNTMNLTSVPVRMLPVLAGSRVLSRRCHHAVPMHVVGKIPEPYFCPGSYFGMDVADDNQTPVAESSGAFLFEEVKHQAKELKKEADRHLSEARQKAKEIVARGEKKESAAGEADK